MRRAGIIFVNPVAGSNQNDEHIRAAFAEDEVVECDPDHLAENVRGALRRNPAFIGIAGGDGSVRSGVEEIVSGDAAMAVLPIPTGTRNHFARELHIETIDDAAAAAAGGHTRVIDVGEVNEHLFINNSSVGVYPRLVAYREGRLRRLPKGAAAIGAAWHQLRFGKRIRLVVDGEPVTAWAVFVGNNCYGDSLRDLAGREELDAGILDVRIAHADRRLSRVRIVAAVLFGRVRRSPLIDRRQLPAVELDFGAGVDVPVALDGEVMTLTSPLRFRSSPRALNVLADGDQVGRVSDGRP